MPRGLRAAFVLRTAFILRAVFVLIAGIAVQGCDSGPAAGAARDVKAVAEYIRNGVQ